jgi:hypothetical protein
MRSRSWHWVTLVLVLSVHMGCAGPTPEGRLVGKWRGAPNAKEAVDQAVDAAAKGQGVNPLARGVARFLGQKVAEATMAVELDLRKGGIVFFRGETSVLGLAPDADGTWEIESADGDVIQLHFGIENKQLRGKILFREEDEFILKLDQPVPAPPPQREQKQQPKPQATQQLSIVFKRDRS